MADTDPREKRIGPDQAGARRARDGKLSETIWDEHNTGKNGLMKPSRRSTQF